jgi:hypothetical protein
MPERAEVLKQLLEAVERYLSGRSTLVEFEAWFVPVAWRIDASVGSQDPLEALTGEIYLRLAQNDLGDLREPKLRELLADATTRARVALEGHNRTP